MKVLVTGAAGYIGSHVCVELLAAGHQVVSLDNHSNSSEQPIQAIKRISGKSFHHVRADVRDTALLTQIMLTTQCEAVMHFAGIKAVGESMADPLRYHEHNVGGTLSVMRAMKAAEIFTLIFSSSATVYGAPQILPFTENHPLRPVNPYGKSKWMAEEMIRDWCASEPLVRACILRYFNPVGAHDSGLIGDNPLGAPNNLMPCIAQVAMGKTKTLTIHGNDYDTPDGSAVRDYLHVVDLAKGHVAALNALVGYPFTASRDENDERDEKFLCESSPLILNLGTGQGVSVLELVRAFEVETGKKIEIVFGPRRVGDIESFYADSSLAQSVLCWKTNKSLAQMCQDSWRFAKSQALEQ